MDPLDTEALPRAFAVLVGPDGRYAGADAGFLELLGYTIDEFRGLRIGELSTGPAGEAAIEVWASVVADLIEPPLGELLDVRAADGRVFRVRLTGWERRQDASHLLRCELVSRRRIAVGRPEALHEILGLWRTSEAHLAALRHDDPERAAVAADARELRELYESEIARLRRDPAPSEAIVYISLDGRYQDPTYEFLALLQADYDTVHGAPVGRFGRPGNGTAALDTFRAFAESGEPVAVSESICVLGDGTEAPFRATTTLDLGDPRRYVCRFERLVSGLVRGPSFRTTATVLSEWREAERELDALPAGPNARRYELLYRVALLRAEYQRLVRNLTEQPV